MASKCQLQAARATPEFSLRVGASSRSAPTARPGVITGFARPSRSAPGLGPVPRHPRWRLDPDASPVVGLLTHNPEHLAAATFSSSAPWRPFCPPWDPGLPLLARIHTGRRDVAHPPGGSPAQAVHDGGGEKPLRLFQGPTLRHIDPRLPRPAPPLPAPTRPAAMGGGGCWVWGAARVILVTPRGYFSYTTKKKIPPAGGGIYHRGYTRGPDTPTPAQGGQGWMQHCTRTRDGSYLERSEVNGWIITPSTWPPQRVPLRHGDCPVRPGTRGCRCWVILATPRVQKRPPKKTKISPGGLARSPSEIAFHCQHKGDTRGPDIPTPAQAQGWMQHCTRARDEGPG